MSGVLPVVLNSYYESTHWRKQEKGPMVEVPYEVTNVQRTDVKNIYTIRNLVTQYEYIATSLNSSQTFQSRPHECRAVEYGSERHGWICHRPDSRDITYLIPPIPNGVL
jgi:hypothetical protein